MEGGRDEEQGMEGGGRQEERREIEIERAQLTVDITCPKDSL